jgi:hypothetical protein
MTYERQPAPAGPVEQGPGAAPTPAAPPARVLALQRSAGNQAVARMLARAPAAETAFNPWSVVHDLRRAIDQSDVAGDWRFDDSGAMHATTRKVDEALAARVLERLTPPQLALVKSLYQAQEGTTLENDLLGSGQSGHASNLKPDERARIETLLKRGTDSRLEAAAIELHELLSGDLDEAGRERVMTLLRRPADEHDAIDGHYQRLFNRHPGYDLALKLKGPQLERALALRAGDAAKADAHAIEAKRRALADLEAKRAAGDLSVPEAWSFEGKRRQLIDGITGTVEANRHAAIADPANAGKPADQAVKEQLAHVMAMPVGPAGAKLEDELAFTLKGTEAAGIVVADHSLVETSARRLLELEARHATDALKVAELLRGLRAQAEHDPIASIPAQSPATQQALLADPLAKERLVADRAARYLEMFIATYNFVRLPNGRPWAAIVASASAANREMLDALTAGAGELGSVDELRFAIKRGDAAGIEKVLREHPTGEDIAELERAYDEKFKPEVLRDALFGLRGADAAAGTQGPLPVFAGVAKGRDAARIQELLDAPSEAERGGAKEVAWIVRGAERELDAAEANSGAIGGLRELGDNPETQRLMRETVAQLRMLQQRWIEHPEQRDETLAEMRQVRATLTGDASAYEQDNERVRAQVQSAVSLAVQVALAIALPGVGTEMSFLSSTALNIGASVGANFAIYGDKYDLAMLYNDVVVGGFAAIGGKLGEDVAALVVRQITKDAAETAVRVAGRTSRLAEELELAAAQAQAARERMLALAEDGLGETLNLAGNAGATALATGDASWDSQVQAFLIARMRHRGRTPKREERVMQGDREKGRRFHESEQGVRNDAAAKLEIVHEQMQQARRDGGPGEIDRLIAEIRSTDPAFADEVKLYYDRMEDTKWVEDQMAFLWRSARRNNRTVADELEHILGGGKVANREFWNTPGLKPEDAIREFQVAVKNPRTLIDMSNAADHHGSHTHAFQQFLGDRIFGPGGGARFRQRLAALEGTAKPIRPGFDQPFWSQVWDEMFDAGEGMHSPEALGKILQHVLDFPRWRA